MAKLEMNEVLYIPKRRRLTHDRFKAEDGQEVLHLFYGEVELIFDEPEIAPVGQKLLEVEQFRAEDAMTWSSGAPHSWDKIRDLLEALIEQQVLSRVSDAPAGRTTESFPERLGEVPVGREPLTFSGHDNRCPAITEKASGQMLRHLPHRQELVRDRIPSRVEFGPLEQPDLPSRGDCHPGPHQTIDSDVLGTSEVVRSAKGT